MSHEQLCKYKHKLLNKNIGFTVSKKISDNIWSVATGIDFVGNVTA